MSMHEIRAKLNAEPVLWSDLGELPRWTESVTFVPGDRIDTLEFAAHGDPTPWTDVGEVICWPEVKWLPPAPKPSAAKPAPAGLTRTATDGERLGRLSWMPGAS